jgi:hypothetical protein
MALMSDMLEECLLLDDSLPPGAYFQSDASSGYSVAHNFSTVFVFVCFSVLEPAVERSLPSTA